MRGRSKNLGFSFISLNVIAIVQAQGQIMPVNCPPSDMGGEESVDKKIISVNTSNIPNIPNISLKIFSFLYIFQ